jgi:hypothetical protein
MSFSWPIFPVLYTSLIIASPSGLHGPPPGCGRSVTDCWGCHAHEVQLHCPDLPLKGKILMVEPRIEPETSWSVVRNSDHEAGHISEMFNVPVLHCLRRSERDLSTDNIPPHWQYPYFAFTLFAFMTYYAYFNFIRITLGSLRMALIMCRNM